MPIDLVILGTVLGIAVGTILILYTLAMFRDWIRTKIGSYRNKQVIAGLVKQHLDSGDYKLVQFLFDEKKDKFVNAEAVQTALLDDELLEKFENEKDHPDVIFITEEE